MARKLVCSTCNQYLIKDSAKFKEFWESIYGKSKGRYICDVCGFVIQIDDGCWAGVLLVDKNDKNYKLQKPEFWMDNYITVCQK